MGMETEIKECPQCKNQCREVDARCKNCGYRFWMVCGGCGRDVRGRTLCNECSVPGYKRCADPRSPNAFKSDLFDFERLDEKLRRREVDVSHPEHGHYLPYRPWDCYDQYKRLQKLNKK